MTSVAVAQWQMSRWLVYDGIFGGTSKGIMFPKGVLQGCDFSFTRQDPVFLTTRGIYYVGTYLWQEFYQDGRRSKGVTRAEIDANFAAGVQTMLYYEESAETRFHGYAEGERQARAALAHWDRLGLGTPESRGVAFHFNVDHDASLADTLLINEACRGAANIIGFDCVGLYGEYDVIRAALDAGVVKYTSQTYAWSRGLWDERATTQQWSNGQWGGTIDFNRAMFEDFGQIKL